MTTSASHEGSMFLPQRNISFAPTLFGIHQGMKIKPLMFHQTVIMTMNLLRPTALYLVFGGSLKQIWPLYLCYPDYHYSWPVNKLNYKYNSWGITNIMLKAWK